MKLKSNIIIDKSKLKNIKIKTSDLKLRIKYLLSLLNSASTEVSIKFCGTEEMIEANGSFRKKSYATDVLSFPGGASFYEGDSLYLGDILICVPVCIEQAKKAKLTISQELEKMIIHAIVHLKGLDHERGDAHYRVMNQLEIVLQQELVKECKKPTWCSAVI